VLDWQKWKIDSTSFLFLVSFHSPSLSFFSDWSLSFLNLSKFLTLNQNFIFTENKKSHCSQFSFNENEKRKFPDWLHENNTNRLWWIVFELMMWNWWESNVRMRVLNCIFGNEEERGEWR